MTKGEEEAQLRVALRVRPLNDAELRRGETQCAFQLDDKRVLLIDPEKFSDDILRQNRLHERQFVFDVAFGHDSTQADIHRKTTQPLIDPVLNGYNATVFAYGATGSGKTYTMLGTEKEPGVMMRVTKELYQKIEHNRTEFDAKYDVRLSYLEVYNEVIRDLMNPSSGMLELREDSKGNIQVPGLSSIPADSSTEILDLLQEGNRQRTQEPTAANQTSSRSHAVLQVTVKKTTRTGTLIGKLFMIDLAGSERASQTKNRGQRMIEGAAINRSLLALGNVINSLSSHNKAKRYVNYRDSKLTRLLKDSLGGNSKTCMIAHVTPASYRYDETHNTLVYANRAKNITTKASVNQNEDSTTDVRYNMAIGELKKEIERLKTNVSSQQPRILRSESSHQLSDRRNTSYKNGTSPRPNNDSGEKKQQRVTLNVPQTSSQKKPKTAPSEFLTLKEQYLALSQEELKIRPQLLRANEEAYDVQMSKVSKEAILTAWDRQKASTESVDHDPETIDRLRKDVAAQESRMSELQEVRKDLERELESLGQTADRVEQKLRAAADGKEQRDLVDMLVRMRILEAEKMAIESDSVLLNKRMEKHDTSLKKVQKYGVVADQLIERQKTFAEGGMDKISQTSDAPPEEFDKLYQEYRLLKNQVQYHMVPLSPTPNELNNLSWNHQLLNRQKNGGSKPTKHASSSSDLSKTHNITTLRALQGKTSSVTRFPPIMTLPGALSKDDSEVSYYRSQKQKSTSKGGRRKVLSGRRGSQASVSSSMGAEYPRRAHSESRHRSKIVIRNPPNRRVKSPTTAKRSTLPQVIIR